MPQLPRLLWLHAAPDEQSQQSVEYFALELHRWWSAHGESHVAFIARDGGATVVGMAWLALVARVPRPGVATRRSGDIQSLYVLPEERGRRIGSALVQAATEHALRLGAGRVTVQSGSKAVPLYERLGFTSSRQLLQTPVS